MNIDNSRRSFLKQMSIGSAGLTFGGCFINRLAYANPLEQEEKSILFGDRQFSPVYPIPQKAEYEEGSFSISEATKILLPNQFSENDKFLANLLRAELAEKYGIIVNIKITDELALENNYILIGTANNYLLRNYDVTNRLTEVGPEGYYLIIGRNSIVIYAQEKAGSFYGLQSLRQLILHYGPNEIQCVNIHDWSFKPFRGIRIYVPGPENIIFYKRFIKDFMAFFKYNKVILEMNACMRLENHPELNAGSIEFNKDLIYTRRSRVTGPHQQIQNSTHHDVADGKILSKDQVADLVSYAKKFHIETIPEIPSLSHVFYLLTRHRELAEIKNAEWPDTYCPSNENSRKLYFEVLDEYIQVINPKMIHIGHDEWRMPTHVCQKCKDKDYKELFINDVISIHDYLKRKNIRIAMWGDHLLKKRRTTNLRPRTSQTGYKYTMPGAITPDQLNTKIPKDILVFNWSWKVFKKGRGEENEQQISEAGLEQIFGNFETFIKDYEDRSKLKGIIGGAPSAWVATNELNFGKINLHKFFGCANLLWSENYINSKETLSRYLQHMMPVIRTHLKGVNLPSQDGDPIVALSISNAFNYNKDEEPFHIPLKHLKRGKITTKKRIFKLNDSLISDCALVVGNVGKQGRSLPLKSDAIKVNKDVSSLIFLHSCAYPADNVNGFFKIHAFEDTADLLGWYKVVYEDGLMEIVPIRYGINIKEWHMWGNDPRTRKQDRSFEEPYYNGRGSFCYEGDVVNCSTLPNLEINFFAYEWRNPRFGSKIKEVFLEGSTNFRNSDGEIIDSNAISLIAMSYVEKRNINTSAAK